MYIKHIHIFTFSEEKNIYKTRFACQKLSEREGQCELFFTLVPKVLL